MGLTQRLSLNVGTDSRVLKSQLEAITGLGKLAWFTTPFWALTLAWLGSAACGCFGHQSLAVAAIFPVIVCLVSFSTYRLYQLYRRDADTSDNKLQLWASRFLFAQIAISAAWGTFPWLLWQDDSLLNHVFILLAMATTVSSLMISRVSNMGMFMAGVVPLVVMTTLRFALAGTWEDLGFALLTPLYAAHIFSDGRRFINRLEGDARLRFNVEDMAGALTRARDEAIKKRYEAESASASKTAFLANMSHELRTPLNAILGFSDIIAHQSMGRDEIDRYSDYARDIHSSGAHLLSLINDLLDVAKIESGKMEIDPRRLDPRGIIEGVARLVAAKAMEKNLPVKTEIAAGTPLVMADERALKQMLLNLLSNAVKFTPEGGHVTITCQGVPDGGLELSVIDDGPGIAPDKLARVFEPFSQIDNRYDRQSGGTGLGLALVQGLTLLHGGRVWLESKPGAGVRATIYLPASIAAGAVRASA